MRSTHIKGEGVSKVYFANGTALKALSDVNFTAERGEFLSILGPSGCGKSTLLRIIGGILKPSGGRVEIDGEDPREAQRKKEIGFVFQDASLLPWRTVRENIELPLEVNKQNAQKRRRSVDDLLELVGLEDFENYYPYQLSGGMQQRVSVARALVFSPSLLLMDEPLSSLDEITRSSMRYELLRIWDALRATVIFVTHSIPEAIILSDRVLVFTKSPGRVRASIPVDLPRPRDESLEDGQFFHSYVNQLKTLLREGGW